MNVTVILCTYNRCGDLAKTLDSLASSTLPSSVAWEVLVVDNNSNDQTRDVALDFCRRYPNRFRYLFEPHPGKSYALNSGIREAHGEILAFTDDDLIVDTTWLQNLTIPFGNGAWAGVGGRTLLEQGFSPPHWLALNGWYGMGGILALCDFGDKPRELDWPPYGANMAFRKKMFEKYGGFRTDLGPTPEGKIPRPNEDTEFGRRLMAAGERLWYEPSAVVHHPVPEKRLKKSYFLAWWFDYGRALTREKGKRPHFYGIPRHHLSIPTMIVTRMPVDMLRWVLTWDPQRRFFWKSRVWLTAGAAVEAYRVARDANERNEQK